MVALAAGSSGRSTKISSQTKITTVMLGYGLLSVMYITVPMSWRVSNDDTMPRANTVTRRKVNFIKLPTDGSDCRLLNGDFGRVAVLLAARRGKLSNLPRILLFDAHFILSARDISAALLGAGLCAVTAFREAACPAHVLLRRTPLPRWVTRRHRSTAGQLPLNG
jgi:hypothetical protein